MSGVARWLTRLAVAAVLGGVALTAVGLASAGASALTPDGDIATSGVTCDTKTHEYVLTWAVSNYIESRGVSITQVSGPGALTYLASKGATGTTVPSTFFLMAAFLDNTNDVITPTQAWIVERVPGTTKNATLSALFTWVDGTGGPVSGAKTLAGTCVAAKVVPTARPAATFHNACNGTVRITLSDAVTGAPSVAYTVTTGSSHQSVTVAANQTRTVTVPAGSATAISVHASGFTKGPIAWSAPSGCATPPATGKASPTVTGGTTSTVATPAAAGCPSTADVAIVRCGTDPAIQPANGSTVGAVNTAAPNRLPLILIAAAILLLLIVLLGLWLVTRRRREA